MEKTTLLRSTIFELAVFTRAMDFENEVRKSAIDMEEWEKKRRGKRCLSKFNPTGVQSGAFRKTSVFG